MSERTSRSIVAAGVLALCLTATATPSASAGDVETALAPTPGPASPSLAPTASLSFDAIRRQGATWPADPTGALGERYILTAANVSYALYDLAGNEVIGPNDLATLLQVSPGAKVSDPRVVYDQYEGRFVLAYLVVDERDRRSWIYLVSIPDETATDPSTWCGARVIADRRRGDGAQFADAPGLGYDADRVAVTASLIDFRGGFRGAMVLAFPKGRLYDCSRELRFDTFTGLETRSPTGRRAITIQPAVTVGDGRSLYLTSIDAGRPSFLVLWRLSGASGSMTLRSAALRVPAVRRPPFGTQGGGGASAANTWWDTGDVRLVSAFADLDRDEIYTAHAVERDVAEGDGHTESVVRWYEIDPAGTLGASRLERVGTVGASGVDLGWPSVATDSLGNLFVTYNRASALHGEYLSAWIAEVAPGSTVAEQALLATGSAQMEAIAGPERWGGTTAIARDPADGGSVIAVNQVAVTDGIGPTRDWQQTVHIVSDGP